MLLQNVAVAKTTGVVVVVMRRWNEVNEVPIGRGGFIGRDVGEIVAVDLIVVDYVVVIVVKITFTFNCT